MIHSVPVFIQHDGPASISDYFKIDPIDNHFGWTFRASFRGVPWKGADLKLEGMECRWLSFGEKDVAVAPLMDQDLIFWEWDPVDTCPDHEFKKPIEWINICDSFLD